MTASLDCQPSVSVPLHVELAARLIVLQILADALAELQHVGEGN